LLVNPQNPTLPVTWWDPQQPAASQTLKPHQLAGLRFMWSCLVAQHGSSSSSENGSSEDTSECVSEDSSRRDPDGSSSSSDGSGNSPAAAAGGGCILAHSMGPGKSFQTVALLWLLFQKR
jgi:SNF2 family DNA or RNA helicase